LGEVLLDIGRPREAIEWFDQALGRNPNRSLSVLGLARARMALGETDAATRRYRELLANFDEADGDLPELAEARRALEQPTTAPPTSRSRTVAIVVTVLVAAASTVFVVIRRRETTRRRAGKAKKTPARESRRT
jgi:tetratricopeptide (TPR) repeat protein